MFIYLVTNTISGKVYVGQTTQTVEARWEDHLYDVDHGSTLIFHNAIRSYGKDVFKLETLCRCPNQQALNKAEIFFIWVLGASKRAFGYNMTLGGSFGKLSLDAALRKQEKVQADWDRRTLEEKRKRMFAAFSVPWSEERRAAKRKEVVGIERPAWVRKKMSDAHIRQHSTDTPEQRKAYGARMRQVQLSCPSFKGRTHTEENRRIMSEASKAYWTPERRAEKSEQMRANRKKEV